MNPSKPEVFHTAELPTGFKASSPTAMIFFAFVINYNTSCLFIIRQLLLLGYQKSIGEYFTFTILDNQLQMPLSRASLLI